MITITWGHEDKIILQYTFEGAWDINDLIEALDAGVDVANRYDHHIDVLVDLTYSGAPNLLGMNTKAAFKKAMQRTNEHVERSPKDPGTVVIVTTHPIMRRSLQTMLSLYSQMASSQIVVADSVEEGREQILLSRQTVTMQQQSA